MSETVELIIGDRQIKRFMSYSVDSNIYAAAGSITVSLHPDYVSSVHTGDRCVFKVGGTIVFTGIIERVGGGGNKEQYSFDISGRDLMGLVVDYYIESFTTLRNKTLSDVAEHYLRQIDYVKQLNITYLDGCASMDVAQEYIQPSPGMTVFDLLSRMAASRGMHFYMRPNGNIVFGKPRGYGSGVYAIWRTPDGNCNYTDFSWNDDISQRNSRVTVVGQDESQPSTPVSEINKKAVLADNTFPAFTKPLVVETDGSAKRLSQQARMIIEQQRFNGWSVQYTVAGHAQRGTVWAPDTICAIDDSRIGLCDSLLVYGRTFIGSKKEQSTKLILGKLGVAA